MSKAEKFIIDSTKNYSNEKRITVGKISHWEKQSWLTPDDARKAVEIAREELMEEFIEKAITFLEGAHEYIDDKKLQLQYDNEGLIRGFRQFMRE